MSRKSNPGAHEAMESVVSELAAELSRGSNMNAEDATAAVGLQVVGAPPAGLLGNGKADGTRFILYLSKETWIGEPGEALAEEVRKARAAGTPITMVHSTPDNEDDGCDFSLFFATTPADLIQDGLYSALAFALYPPPFRHVSACLVARSLGAKQRKAKNISVITEALTEASIMGLQKGLTGSKRGGSGTAEVHVATDGSALSTPSVTKVQVAGEVQVIEVQVTDEPPRATTATSASVAQPIDAQRAFLAKEEAKE